MRFAFYDTDGRITTLLTAPSKGFADLQDGDYLEVGEEVSPDSHYIDLEVGECKPKTVLSPQIVVEGLTATLEGLPAGLNVTSNQMSTVTDDSALVISYDTPGLYQVEFRDNVEYLDHELEVTVGDT